MRAPRTSTITQSFTPESSSAYVNGSGAMVMSSDFRRGFVLGLGYLASLVVLRNYYAWRTMLVPRGLPRIPVEYWGTQRKQPWFDLYHRRRKEETKGERRALCRAPLESSSGHFNFAHFYCCGLFAFVAK